MNSAWDDNTHFSSVLERKWSSRVPYLWKICLFLRWCSNCINMHVRYMLQCSKIISGEKKSWCRPVGECQTACYLCNREITTVPRKIFYPSCWRLLKWIMWYCCWMLNVLFFTDLLKMLKALKNFSPKITQLQRCRTAIVTGRQVSTAPARTGASQRLV